MALASQGGFLLAFGRNNTMLEYSILKTEIQTDPSGLGYSQATSDLGVANIINSTFSSGQRPIPSLDLIAWAGQSGRYKKIVDATASGDVNAASIAFAAQKILDRPDAALDLSLSDRQQMLGGLVFYGVLTSGDSTSLYSLGLSPLSRAEYLFGPGVTISEQDIGIARNG